MTSGHPVAGGGGFGVRAAGPGDIPAILAINRAGVPGVNPLGPAEVAAFLNLSPWFRVAESGGVPGAYLIALFPEAEYGGEEFLWFKSRFADWIYVDQVAVAETLRGRGAASALYADLESFAAGRGARLLALEVNLRPENRPSLRFHERRGFSEVGRLETADRRLVSLRMKEIGTSRPGRHSGSKGA